MPETASISILDHYFELDLPYAEGHVCSAAEATALNSAYRDAVRNKFTPRLKALVQARASEATIKEDFLTAAAEFSFSATPGRRRSGDKVTTLARDLARDYCTAICKRRSISWDALSEDGQQAMISTALERNPKLREEAERRLNTVATELDSILDV